MAIYSELNRSSKENSVIDAALKILALQYIMADAMVVFPGRWEHTRVEFGVRLWKEKQSKYLLIAGVSEAETATLHRYDKKYLSEHFGIAEDHPFVSTQGYAAHTYAQAEWITDKVLELNLPSFVLTASYYHIPRAYMTMLKSLLNRKIYEDKLPRVFPAPTQPLIDYPPEYAVSELEKIINYSQRGNVADLNELIQYLKKLQ